MIQVHYPAIGHPVLACNNAYVASWLASPPAKNEHNHELLAVELLLNRKNLNSTRHLEKAEDVFFKIFADTDVWARSTDIIMGAEKNDLRCNMIRNKDLWQIKRQPLVSYCATIECSAEQPQDSISEGIKVHPHPYLRHTARSYRFLLATDKKEILEAHLSKLQSDILIARWIQKSTWDRLLARHHYLLGKGSPEHIYLVGNDAIHAKESLFTKLIAQQIPCLEEWKESLWVEFQLAGWIVPLVGSGWKGFKLALSREEILEMICDLVHRRVLPKPDCIPATIWSSTNKTMSKQRKKTR